MNIKNKINLFRTYQNMETAAKFFIEGNEERIEIDASSTVGTKISQHISQLKDNVKQELKNEVNNL